MNLQAELTARFSQAFADCGLEDSPPVIAPARNPEFGDYQANGAMGAAKRVRRNPRELAAEIVAAVDLQGIASRCEVAGPGFINIFLSDSWLAGRVTTPAVRGHNEAARTVIVDYSSPNIAKEMHVGHIRSTIIGDAMARMLEFQGHRVIRQNHVGDWGTQFGMLLAHLESGTQGDEAAYLADIEGFYRAARERFDSDPAFAEQARHTVVALQAGDPDHLARWRAFVDLSIEHCQSVYERLGVTLTRDDVRGESAYNDDLEPVLTDLARQGLLTESDGAQCVFLDEFRGKDDAPIPMIVRKSDGGYLYSTTDLAAMRFRCGELGAERILYVVDARQGLHLRQLFAVSRKAGYAPPECELEHLAFGTMQGSDGTPFKSRDGGIVKLIELLDEAEERALRLVSEKSNDLDDDTRRRVARAVGTGALKYADLSRNRTNDYVFDWDEMLALVGNTGPYLQYANARIASVFRTAELAPEEVDHTVVLGHAAERELALRLLRFDESLDVAQRDGAPHVLCAWLYSVATAYSTFYEQCPVLKADDPEVRGSRLMLCRRTGEALRQGLDLLGIEALERM